jgi:hypothetical protein
MNYVILPLSVKKKDLFDSSPKWIHKHTICVVIFVYTKHGLENAFIHFNSFFLMIFVNYKPQTPFNPNPPKLF